ncbi:MAG: V-type ATP synthase subunit F [Candidatus Palauibacterales bacterium]|nr:V-type ATP synthase subunit F [Candidatus Palauibacterales bacterium]MDP2529027.1 V-type ATP synthase subunit F [Candidatus Palauibacterales bacterium]MDP2583846.1 V-type ATP synthase subunit F [Candidatus Palauibacterales bacterium]
MKRRTRIVCTPALAPGFRLAGLPVQEAVTAADAARELSALRRRPEVGIVLMEEGLFEALAEEERAAAERGALPIVVPFPGPEWARAEDAEAYVVRLLRRAIGYRVRLR